MAKRERNFSINEYWNRIAADFEPLLRFKGTSQADWESWHAEAYAKFMELLGAFPEPVDLDPEVEYSVEDGDLIRERVVFDSEQHMSVPCQVLRPQSMRPDKSSAAIVCSHGHGVYAKDAVAGMRYSEAVVTNIREHNYNYAQQMAQAGFLTIAPDLRVFGERRDTDPRAGCDPCDANFVKGAIMGIYTLTLNIWDMKRCVDYLATRPEVDPGRIGMMGLSQGGTMTTFTAAAEPRIKAADIIGYVNPWRVFGIRRGWFCGSQVVPNIYRYLDTDDIAGLIAPRPLLVEMGIYDDCFPIHDLLAGYAGIERIYAAAGVSDRLWADVHPGGHAFSGAKASKFFQRYL
jgi:Abhydrolase family